MLSAVSQQIQTIQEALKSQSESKDQQSVVVELVGKQVRVSTDMAIFITMNPGYAGRSNLPDNLKKLFRSLAMTTPDRQLIAEVMLFSQGFRTAEKLACKIVPFFKLCDEQLSNQSHYDFGLRALKSVLVSAGNVKRDRIMRIKVCFNFLLDNININKYVFDSFRIKCDQTAKKTSMKAQLQRIYRNKKFLSNLFARQWFPNLWQKTYPFYSRC